MRWPDWVLLLASGLLVLAGPAMALVEWGEHQDLAARADLTGEVRPQDASFRAAWRLPLGGLVLLAGILGTYACVRVLARPVARSVSRRLVALMVVGMTVLDVAFLVDGAAFMDAPHALRAATIVWGYTLGGILVGGSGHRLAEVVTLFGDRAR